MASISQFLGVSVLDRCVRVSCRQTITMNTMSNLLPYVGYMVADFRGENADEAGTQYASSLIQSESISGSNR